jgi:hypothetical protein
MTFSTRAMSWWTNAFQGVVEHGAALVAQARDVH